MFPSVMRTGLLNEPSVDPQLLQKISNILTFFMEKAVVLSAQYAHAAGRNTLTSTDVKYALQYQSQHFNGIIESEDDLESKLDQYQNETETESETDDDTDDESETESETDDDTDDDTDTDDEEFTRCDDSEDPLIQEMNRCHDQWEQWEPQDPLHKLLKKAVDQIDIDNGSPIA
jgi:hypothetical protein